MNAKKKPDPKKCPPRVLITNISDRQLRAAGFRKVPKRIAEGSFEDFVKWKYGKRK